ncbi:MAG: hypothetical protein HZC47_10665 [Methanobacterium sp.]|uniref:hypothetical protein n=1 Tax=Methanobacterium sp. TaxID=2164 RepID=UPI003D658AB4|nr:hypothetical protein [Methanobacterium sp.]
MNFYGCKTSKIYDFCGIEMLRISLTESFANNQNQSLQKPSGFALQKFKEFLRDFASRRKSREGK